MFRIFWRWTNALSPVVLFVAGAFVGPLFGLAVRPYLDTGSEVLGHEMENMLRDIRDLLMPAGILAVFKYTVGMIGALLLVLGGQLIIYVSMGVAVTIMARSLITFIIAIVLQISSIVLVALWLAGFEYAYVNWWALVVALSFYCSLSLLTGWIVRRNRAARQHPVNYKKISLDT